jgi:5-methylcytosine-specific restriction enzyme A
MTKRRSITTAMRVRIFNAAGGVCHLCKLPIHAERGEKWHVEHIKPLWLGGEDAEANMAPAHVDCHAPKTREEAHARAKSTRQAARNIGAEGAPKKTLVSRGFEKTSKAPRIQKQPLPPRQLYEDIT